MIKVLILGSTGMMGNAVGKYFLKQKDYQTVLSYRNDKIAYGENRFWFDVMESKTTDLPKVDYIINCIGVIKPFIEEDRHKSIFVNSLFPYQLASYCESENTRLIQITTDCVFSGLKGSYTENSLHDCADFYGKTKSLGEPSNCMVLRTSIIGEEIHQNASLVEWAKQMKGKNVNGFINHYWNGMTTKQYAKICDQIIRKELYAEGSYHIYSNPVNKFQLLQLISEKFKLNLNITKHRTENDCNRILGSERDLINNLNVDSIEQQIQDL